MSSRYPLERRLGGLQNQSERGGKRSWPYQDSNSNPSVAHYTTGKLAETANEDMHLRRCKITHFVINRTDARFPGEVLYRRLTYSAVRVRRWTTRSRCCPIASTLCWVKIKSTTWGHHTTLEKYLFCAASQPVCFNPAIIGFPIVSLSFRYTIKTACRVASSSPSHALTKCGPLFSTCFLIQKGGETKREQREIKTWVFVI
jgi:hypothetical protein